MPQKHGEGLAPRVNCGDGLGEWRDHTDRVGSCYRRAWEKGFFLRNPRPAAAHLREFLVSPCEREISIGTFAEVAPVFLSFRIGKHSFPRLINTLQGVAQLLAANCVRGSAPTTMKEDCHARGNPRPLLFMPDCQPEPACPLPRYRYRSQIPLRRRKVTCLGYKNK